MATIKEVSTHYKKQVWRDTNNKDGSVYICKSYFNDSDGGVEVDNIDDLDNKTEISCNSEMVGENSLLISCYDDLDNGIDYDRVYLCNHDDEILNVVTIEKKTDQKHIKEDFLVRFEENDVILTA